MKMSLAEILDRWTICKLKVERIGEKVRPEFEELDVALLQEEKRILKTNPHFPIQQMKDYLLAVNDAIWQCEAGLKSGKEKLANPTYLFDTANNDALIKIGTATMIIRNFNELRVKYKNFINSLVGEGYCDIKKNHCSE